MDVYLGRLFLCTQDTRSERKNYTQYLKVAHMGWNFQECMAGRAIDVTRSSSSIHPECNCSGMIIRKVISFG